MVDASHPQSIEQATSAQAHQVGDKISKTVADIGSLLLLNRAEQDKWAPHTQGAQSKGPPAMRKTATGYYTPACWHRVAGTYAAPVAYAVQRFVGCSGGLAATAEAVSR